MEIKNKFCPRCGCDLPLTAFSRNKAQPSGLCTYCRQCTSTYKATEHRLKLQREAVQRKRARDPVAHKLNLMIWTARKRAKEKQLAFNLTAGYLQTLVTSHCPALGIELDWPSRGLNQNSPTLDRIKGELGYVPGNVAIISFRANSIKRDAEAAELFAVATWLDNQNRTS